MDSKGKIFVKCWQCGESGTFPSIEEAISDKFNFPELGQRDEDGISIPCICDLCLENQARKGRGAKPVASQLGILMKEANKHLLTDEELGLTIQCGQFSDILESMETDDIVKLHKELLRDYHLNSIMEFDSDKIVSALKRLGWRRRLTEAMKNV